MTREIPLTQGLVAIVDEQDYPLLSRLVWYAQKGPNTWYAWNAQYGAMHRLICGTPANKITDHRNQNGLDNRRENLRIVDKQQNGMNRRKQSGLSSAYLGVTFRNTSWKAQLWHGGKRFDLGAFLNEKDAARARDRKAVELFAEYAALNFPVGDPDHFSLHPEGVRFTRHKGKKKRDLYPERKEVA